MINAELAVQPYGDVIKLARLVDPQPFPEMCGTSKAFAGHCVYT